MKKKVLSAVLAASMCMSFLAPVIPEAPSPERHQKKHPKKHPKRQIPLRQKRETESRFPLPSALASSLRLWIRAFPRRQSIGMPWLICMPVCIKN